jgi:hypothetical protein
VIFLLLALDNAGVLTPTHTLAAKVIGVIGAIVGIYFITEPKDTR